MAEKNNYHDKTRGGVMIKAEKKNYITYLTVLASLAVVMLHCNFRWYGFGYERSWVTSNFLRSVMIFAVPVFFMVTGATLIDYRKRYSTEEFVIKRVKRTVIPFLAWSVIGGVLIMAEKNQWLRIDEFTSAVLGCKFIDFYWFFPALFGVYLAIPFLSLIPEDKRKSAFAYAIICGFVLNSLLPFVTRFLPITYDREHFIFPATGGYLLLVLIGYYLSHFELIKKQRIVVYSLGIVGLLMMIFGTWWASFDAGKISYMFEGYQNVPCVLYSTAIFLVVRNMKSSKLTRIFDRVLVPFAGLAYGIYLVQWFVLHFVAKVEWIDRGGIWYRTLGGVSVYLICAAVVWVLKKMPVTRRIV